MNSFNKKVYILVAVILLLVFAAAVLFVKLYGTHGKNDDGIFAQKPTLKSEMPTADNGEKESVPFNKNEDSAVVSESKENSEKHADKKQTLIEIAEQSMGNVQGKCQWGFSLFSEGVSYTAASYAAPSASVIKVFIMEYAFSLIEKGELSQESSIEGRSVNSLLYDMITWSDNTATNIFIDYFGMDKMNAFFSEKGYADTRLERKMLDTAAQSEGRENYTSVNDTMHFLTKLYENRGVKPYSDMLEIMKKQQVSTKIRRRFKSGITIANKTGELSNVENDIGIIFGENGDMAVSFMCSSLSDTASARNAISLAAYELACETVFK